MKKQRKAIPTIRVSFSIAGQDRDVTVPRGATLYIVLSGLNQAAADMMREGGYSAVVRKPGQRWVEQEGVGLSYKLRDGDQIKIGPDGFAEDPRMRNPPGSLADMLYGPYDE